MEATNDLPQTADVGEITDDEMASVAGGNPILVGIAVAVCNNILENGDEAWAALKDGWNSV